MMQIILLFNHVNNLSKLFNLKIIDMIKEMDIAKLFQILIAKYNTWDTIDNNILIIQKSEYVFNIPPKFISFNSNEFDYIINLFHNNQYLFKRSIFILGTYLIRMIPFLIKKSNNHALLAIVLSSYYMSYT